MLLLGDQLIRDSGIAAFELVKNAYDADSTKCEITLLNIDADDDSGRIIIEDDGHGMCPDTVRNVWLEPGTEHRLKQKMGGMRTAKFKRFPLGEKGVGRFAVHKLGRRITLVTRAKNSTEVVVKIDWNEFERESYLSEIGVSVIEREPTVFKGKRTGTKIEISDLRDRPWNRGRIRALHRAIVSICSPFNEPDSFSPYLHIEPDKNWLKGLLSPKDVVKHSLFKFIGKLVGDAINYDYTFSPPKTMEHISPRQVRNRKLILRAASDTSTQVKPQHDFVDLSKFSIGKISFNLHIFDREPAVLQLTATDPSGLKSFLDKNGGVRVYRDGVRVFDFGEPGNDWLELGGRRVNVPAKRIGNNQIIGAVNIASSESGDLIEKTNREGFVENEAYSEFRRAIAFAVKQAEAERNRDKKTIRTQYSRSKKKEPVTEDLASLRSEIERMQLSDSLGPYIDRIETQYREVQDRLLVAAGAGLNLASVLHEVEKGIHELHAAINNELDRSRLVELAKRLTDMVDGLSWLTKRSGKTKIKASTLLHQTMVNSDFRFRGHNIQIVNGIEQGDPDFSIRCSRRLITACLMNLIDNSIYWLDSKSDKKKAIYIGTTYELNGLPAIVVADSGTGFIDPPEYLVQPFFSRKPDGIGLGLHIVDEVMKTESGRLIFPERDDISLPEEFLNGAIVLLEFSKEA